MRRKRLRGFSVAETLLSLLVVGIILGIVARGYQALSRLNLATYQMSQRMELTAFLQRLSHEVSSAIKMTVASGNITFSRVNPTLNLEYEETTSTRLPWPIPPNATSSGLLNPAYIVTNNYQYLPVSKEIQRTAFGGTETVAVNIGEFTPALETGGRVLAVEVRPGEMTASVKVRILLPVVRP